MKKVISFVIALMLFCGTVWGMHIYSSKSMALHNNSFSTWSNESKFNCKEAIVNNLNPHSLVVFGSSEFQHGSKTPYHPKNMFKGFEFNPMLIGAGYYQCLSHAITMASIAKDIPNQKAVLLISPSWFRKDGVKDKFFASRFSQSNYIGMLENTDITPKTKSYIINRTKKLLKVDKPTLKRINSYNSVLLEGNRDFWQNVDYKISRTFWAEKDRQDFAAQTALAGLKSNQNKNVKDTPINWQDYMNQAQADGEKYNTNPFYMAPKSYRFISMDMDKKKDINKGVKNGYAHSPEYGDLKCFLDVCKEQNIDIMLVALPVNGYWFDFKAFPGSERKQYYNNIRNIAKEYNAPLVDLSNEEFTKYFFQDGVHLGGKGWVTVNEKLYDFYQKN
ncbi:MAG: D-alanyl-lipoteichoic acid biosynthesis protein DltD [Clostridiales bacterium]